MAAGFQIADLRDRPEHVPVVAQRIWHTFWEPDGRLLSEVEAALDDVLAAKAFPFSLVATADGRFAGTVTSIMTDIAERPHLGPCLAALWVEPEARQQGIAQALMDAVVTRLAGLGFDEAYLCARPHMLDFYSRRGWSLVEREIGVDRLDIFRRALP